MIRSSGRRVIPWMRDNHDRYERRSGDIDTSKYSNIMPIDNESLTNLYRNEDVSKKVKDMYGFSLFERGISESTD
jgi:hypothetical protein